MDRRVFLKISGAAAGLALLPRRFWSALSGLGEEEIEQRAQALLGQMTLDEKVAQMHGSGVLDTRENRRLGIPGLQCTGSGRGAGFVGVTCFPVPMLRGATWDVDLERRVGEAMGYEARARGNNVVLEPCINLLRHPSWGRAQETYGDDPYHLGALGAANIRGVQRHVMACAKHFAANSIEDSRFYVNVRMDERTLREIYLPHFQACVEAGVASVMSAYNDLNGYLCGHNRRLLTEILKQEWGFAGFVMSDWMDAVEDTAAAANAGLDLEMPAAEHFGRKLKQAVKAGQVSEATIDQAVLRLLRAKLRFIPPDFTSGYDRKRVAGPEHTALAREVAQKGIVLLKNQDRALPLDRGSLQTLLVAGRAAGKAILGDKGSSYVKPPYAVSPLQGIKRLAGSSVKVISSRTLAGAKAAAGKADAVVVVASLNYRDEGEGGNDSVLFGHDRATLDLHPEDEELIQAVAEVNARVIVVVQAGAAITMERWKDRVPAILMAWYPGMEGGQALAEILFGEVNPSGKLPIVFPERLDQLPPFDSQAKEVEYGYYHGYRLLDKNRSEPLFPFGFGLSYTSYQYSNLRLDLKTLGPSGRLTVQVDVTNTGDRAGEEVVQLYVSCQGSKVDRPVKELKGFSRVALAPGETKTVTIELPARDLAYYDVDQKAWVVEGIEYLVMVGPSSRKQDLGLCGTFKITAA